MAFEFSNARDWLLNHWNDAWTEGLWAASWSKSIDGLSPHEAAWKPAPDRHSIWQIVSHMTFWREDALERLATGRGPLPDAEVLARNFPRPAAVTSAAWQETRDRFENSQAAVAAVLRNPAADLTRIQYLLAHDSYHVGQINLIRALLGRPPIE